MNMETLEAEVNTEIKNKMEENMVTATKESKAIEKAGEKWAAFNKTERMAAILDSHTFPGVLKKDWTDINPKLQTRLAGSFAAAKNAKSPVAPVEAPVEANKEVKAEEVKPAEVMSDEEAKVLAEKKMAEASQKAAAKAAARTRKVSVAV